MILKERIIKKLNNQLVEGIQDKKYSMHLVVLLDMIRFKEPVISFNVKEKTVILYYDW